MLASRSGRPLATPAWLLAWWHALRPDDADLRVAACWHGDDLIGIVPTMRVRSGRLVELVALAPSLSGRGVALAEPGRAPLVAALAARALATDGAHRLRFERIDVDDPFPGLLRAAWPGLVRPEVEEGPPLAVPTLDMAGMDFDAWLASKSSNFRQRVRRERRRMEGRGAVLRFAVDPADREWALAQFHRLHAAKWAERSVLASDGGHRMMLEAAGALGPDRFRIHVIESGGAAVSVQLFVAAGRELIYWNGGWDPDWAQHSPALTGIVAALEDGFARGETRLDLGEDDSYDYKTRIADGDRPVRRVVLTPRGRRYPGAVLATAPARAKRLAKAAVGHAPAPVRARLERPST